MCTMDFTFSMKKISPLQSLICLGLFLAFSFSLELDDCEHVGSVVSD